MKAAAVTLRLDPKLEVAGIAELLGAVAVVARVYLAAQVRRNPSAVRASSITAVRLLMSNVRDLREAHGST